MAGKQLSIIVQAVDKATGPLRTVGNAALGVGDAAEKAGKKTKDAADKSASALTFLKHVVEALGIIELVHKITEAFNETARTIVEVGNAGKRLGIPIELMSELRYAAKLTDQDFQGLAASLSTASKNIAQFALTGGGRAADAIKRLHLNLRESDGTLRSIGELLPEILDSLAKADPAERIYLAQKVFGDTKFLHFIDEGTNKLRQFSDEAQRLGVVFTPEQFEAAEHYRQSVMRVGEAWLGLKARLVENLGPSVARLLDQLAGALAAVPKIIETLADNIHKAFSDGLEGTALKLEFSLLGVNLINLLADLFSSGGEIAALALLEGITRILRGQVGKIVFAAKSMGELTAKWFASGFTTDAGEIAKMLNDTLAGITQVDSLQLLNSRLEKSAAYSEAWHRAVQVIGQDLAAIGASADAVAGVTAALAQTSIVGLQAKYAVEGLGEAVQDLSKYKVEPIDIEQLKAGAREGTIALVDMSNQVQETAKRAVVDVAQTMSSTLAGAIIDVVSGTKSLKKAFADFASSTLKQVSQLILQFLILRAISGIAGKFAAPSAGGANIQGFGGMGAVLGASGVTPNAGGLVGSMPRVRIPLYHFSKGGMVPGVPNHRDSVLGLLTARERVVNERGSMATSSSTWDYANRGGRLVPAGGGGDVNVVVGDIHVNAGGGGGTANAADVGAATRRAVLSALEEGLAKNPAARERLARRLSVR